MTHKLIKTDNYLLVVDDSVHPYDSSKIGNPLAHLPFKGSPILEGVPLLPQLKDDVDKLANEYFTDTNPKETPYQNGLHIGFKVGFNKAREKYKYTEEDVIKIVEKSRETGLTAQYLIIASQYPTEFECETEPYTVGEMSSMPLGTVNQKPKTITTTQGIQ